jgi:hypothetical protein
MAYKSDRRLLLTEKDEVVEDGDPRGVKLLVAEGGSLEDSEAEKYDLSGGEATADEEDKARPKEIELGGEGEKSAALDAFKDEERIALGSTKPSDEEPASPAKKSSKKAGGAKK